MVRLGLIGCGRIGRVHADSIDVHPRAELAVVYDPIEAAAREVGTRYGAAWGTDVDAVIDDPSIDAVVVASPTPTHVDFLTRAVRAGKAVLCEKPIDLDLARVDACRAEIGTLADRVMVGFNRRFDPSFRDIRTRVAAGEIGTLEQLVIISRDPAPPPAAYVATSGGLFRDMTIHDFDMARFFLGEVVEVMATGANLVSDEIAAAGDIDGGGRRAARRAGRPVLDHQLASLRLRLRPAPGGLRRARHARRRQPASDQRPVLRRRPTPRWPPPYHNFFLDRYTPAYRAEMDHFVTAIETGSVPSPGFTDGRAALVLADAANESLRTGTTVKVSET